MCTTGSACRSPGDWDAANRLQPCRRRHSEGFLIGKLVQTGFGFLLYPPVTLTGRRNYQRSGVGCNWVPSDRSLWRRGARQEKLRMEESIQRWVSEFRISSTGMRRRRSTRRRRRPRGSAGGGSPKQTPPRRAQHDRKPSTVVGGSANVTCVVGVRIQSWSCMLARRQLWEARPILHASEE